MRGWGREENGGFRFLPGRNPAGFELQNAVTSCGKLGKSAQNGALACMKLLTDSHLKDPDPNNTKQVYSVAEFAAQFGRHKSWAYRLIYTKRIDVIKDFGRMMIPKSQIQKILASASSSQD